VSIDNDSSGTSPEGILGEEHPHPRAYGTFPRILRWNTPMNILTYTLPASLAIAALGNWQEWQTGYIVDDTTNESLSQCEGIKSQRFKPGHVKATVPLQQWSGNPLCTPASLLPGTEIMVEGYQAKDGANRANGRDITFKDGKKLFVGSAGTGAPEERKEP